MKRFLKNISRFSFILFGCIILLLLATSFISKRIFNFHIPKHKNILVLGNSHPECAINDSILPNYFNLAQSGTAYFYDYLKAREVISKNSHIDTLIIGYGYGDIALEMDSWFDGKDKIKFKLRNYFFLFNTDDYLSMLESNPVTVLLQTPRAIWYNLYISLKGYSFLGGYRYLKRDKLDEAIRRSKTESPFESDQEISEYQSLYLKKIYDLCKEKNIVMVLLNTPIHPLEEKSLETMKVRYHQFANQNLKGAILIDDSNFKLPKSFYADLDHLNYKGAKKYSKYLKQNDFKDRVHQPNK